MDEPQGVRCERCKEKLVPDTEEEWSGALEPTPASSFRLISTKSASGRIICVECASEIRRMARHDKVRFTGKPVPVDPAQAHCRDPESIRLADCSECQLECLGMSETEWAGFLSPEERVRWPKYLIAGHICGRPVCEACLNKGS